MPEFLPLFLFSVPITAIVGGITLAIVRTIGQTRLEELARRERIAAIERGVDLDKLPPLSGPGQELYASGYNQLRRAHGLLIGGMIVVAVGLGLGIIFLFVEPGHNHWAVGVLPTLVGFALLGSSAVVWPKKS